MNPQVDSRQSFSLNRLLTRNNEINRRLKTNKVGLAPLLAPEALTTTTMQSQAGHLYTTPS